MTDEKTDEFDFTGAKEDETATSGNQEEEKEEASLEEQLAESKIDNAILQEKLENRGRVTPSIIKEARELAGSPAGLDIEKFFDKHKLLNVDIEQLLQAPLNKDGMYA